MLIKQPVYKWGFSSNHERLATTRQYDSGHGVPQLQKGRRIDNGQAQIFRARSQAILE